MTRQYCTIRPDVPTIVSDDTLGYKKVERRFNPTITGDVNALAALLLWEMMTMAYSWDQLITSDHEIRIGLST